MTHPTLRRLGTTTFFLMAVLAGVGAQARTDIGVSIGVPGVVVSPGYAPAPVYVAPQPSVYYAPPPVYLQAPPVEYVPAPGYAPYYAVPRPRYYDDRHYPRHGYRRDRDHDGVPDRYDSHDNRRDHDRR